MSTLHPILMALAALGGAALLFTPFALAARAGMTHATDRIRTAARAHFLLVVPAAVVAFAVGAGRAALALVVAASVSAIVARLPSYRVVHRVRHTLP